MAVPKRKQSKSKTRTRRSQWRKLDALVLVKCPQCHELKMPHMMCGECGYYKQREVMAAGKK